MVVEGICYVYHFWDTCYIASITLVMVIIIIIRLFNKHLLHKCWAPATLLGAALGSSKMIGTDLGLGKCFLDE